MTPRRLIPWFMALVFIGVPALGAAAPSAAIANAMQTPASAFDVYLFRLFEAAKCKNWIGEQETRPDPCMTTLVYDDEQDTLRMHFEMYPTNEAIDDFIEADDEAREQMLLAQIGRLSRRVGIVDTWGMLHSLPLTQAKGFDGKAFQAALAARSELHLHVSYGSKVYTATRDVDGLTDVSVTVRRTN